MREPGDVERRAPVAVAVGRDLEIVPMALKACREQADARPVVEPTVQELKLGRAGRELNLPTRVRAPPSGSWTNVISEWPPFTARAFFADKSLAVERFGLAFAFPVFFDFLLIVFSSPGNAGCSTSR